jgi:hypothetical protein
MVWGKDISLLLKMFHDRSEFFQIFNMKWGYLSEAAVITQDDSRKVAAQCCGSLTVFLTVSDKNDLIWFCLSPFMDEP